MAKSIIDKALKGQGLAEMKRSFKHKLVTNRQDVARYLLALIEGFEKGQLALASGSNEFNLKPTGAIEMDIEAKQHEGHEKLSLSFIWPHEDEPLESTID